MLSQIRHLMESNKYLKAWIPIIVLTPIMQYRRQFFPLIKGRHNYLSEWLGKANATSAQFKDCYEEHKREFDQVSRILEDDFSRRTLQVVINYRLSPNTKTLLPIINGAQYFPRPIIRKAKNEVFIDGGGYKGDSIIALASFWGKNCWKKIYTWEPNEINRGKLIKTIEQYGLKNIKVIPFGLWSEQSELSFSMQGASTCISENGTVRISVDTIDNLCSSEKVTYIKMDIEGSEMQALRGAQNVIRRDKPKLAICIYHKPEDYYEIPLYIKELVPEYKFYIRHHKFSMNDTVCYAVYPK